MKRLCLILGLCLAHSAFAKTSKKVAAQEPAPAPAPREVEAAAEVPRIQDSEFNRGRNQFSMTGFVGFRSSDVLIDAGLTGSYFLTPNDSLNLSMGSVTGSIDEPAGEYDGVKYSYVGVNTEVSGNAYALTLRHFFSNSFYLEGGLDYHHAKGVFKVKNDYFDIYQDLRTELGSYSRISALIQIGNQWQWSSFTLGTSWIGGYIPLAYSHDFEQEDSEDLPKSVKEFRDSESTTHVSFLKFYLGWSF